MKGGNFLRRKLSLIIVITILIMIVIGSQMIGEYLYKKVAIIEGMETVIVIDAGHGGYKLR